MEKGFDYSKNNLIVLSSQGEAFKVYSALNSLYPDQDFVHLPNSEVLPYEFFSSPPNIRSERIKALSDITKQTNKTLVSSIQTLMSPCSNYLHVSNINNLKVGDQFQRQSVISDLEDNGYKRTEVVTESGDFSLRGSLIDLFLGGRFKYYGSDVAKFLLKDIDTENKPKVDPMCSAFPTLTACNLKFAGATGAVDNRWMICILSQNIMNQKIYLALWFWMIFLIISCSLNTIYRIAIVLVPALRKAELVALINTKRSKGHFLEKDTIVRNNWKEICRIGNWFLMQQIGRNSNPYYFRQFLQSLMDLDHADVDHADVDDGAMNEPLVVISNR